MINCAIAGLGRWGRALVEAAQSEPRLRIVRAVEPDANSAASFCEAHGLSVTASLDDVLADPRIDAVLLATPHSLHKGQVIAAAGAGKQVFCEKPLALRRADAAEMFAACRSAGVVLAVGHNRRFWPSMQALRTITASGELGTILHVEGHNSNENSQSITQGWRLSPEESPGGGLTGAGLHVLDGFVSLLGPARQVYARLSAREAGPPPLDTATLAIEFVNGVSATLGDNSRNTVLLARACVRNEGIRRGARRTDDGAAEIRRSACDHALSGDRHPRRGTCGLCGRCRRQAAVPGA
ncbi:Gfo/Idh/MocA family protein [Bradyrhizobium elkanii]|uniref:Gfo/Idh/MocA family protein n=1 Tax=Bradyrhizobium elkanii TaxID=29448 RepID=UPI0035159484